jgi:hypothetical protein
MEEHFEQKKSAKANQTSERDWSNPRNASHVSPRNVLSLEGEVAQETCNPQSDTPNQNSPPSPPQQYQGGGCRGGKGGDRGRGRGYQEKRKWYCIFHKANDNHSSNYYPYKKRFEAILEEEKKEKRETTQSTIPPRLGKTQTLGGALSPILSNYLTSYHLSQITPNHHPGNPRFSKLKTSIVGPLINTPSLLLLLHKKAQPLHLYPRKSRAKTTHFLLSEPFSPFQAALLWSLTAKRLGKTTSARFVISVWREG